MNNDTLIKSPLNYTGGKYKLLPQILPLFPDNINKFVDLFCGGCSVGINVNANTVIFNDNLTYLVDLFNYWKSTDTDLILDYIESTIDTYGCSVTNEEGFKQLRKQYNTNRNASDLYVLLCYSFNHQIRFNNNHEYNSSFGMRKFNDALKSKLILFLEALHNKDLIFTNKDFREFDMLGLDKNDFVYCDPPYLISCGVYQDGKRGFDNWTEKHEKQLLQMLDNLDVKGIRFALSNVLESKGKSNDILKQWSQKYNIHYLNYTYGNCNYQTKDKSKDTTVEVLVTNY